MQPFEFVILFFSIIYTLALNHLLQAAARMIRHRRRIVFSWPHALWMLGIFVLVAGNWLSLWDFARKATLSLGLVAGVLGFVVIQYFNCSLVSPDFEDGDGFDLRRFQEREGATWLLSLLALLVYILPLNTFGAVGEGIQNWASQNGFSLTLFPLVIAALLVRRPWVQVLAPLAFLVLVIAFPILYYPSLR